MIYKHIGYSKKIMCRLFDTINLLIVKFGSEKLRVSVKHTLSFTRRCRR